MQLIDNWQFIPPHYRWRTVDGDGAVYYWQKKPHFIHHIRRWWNMARVTGSGLAMVFGGRVEERSAEHAAESIQERP